MMVRNIPFKYSIDELASEIDALGFQGVYDMMYLPLMSKGLDNVGYAFVNLTSASKAGEFHRLVSKHRFKLHQDKFCHAATVNYAKLQGLSSYAGKWPKRRSGVKLGDTINGAQPDSKSESTTAPSSNASVTSW